jgi:hypothetical protein
MLVSITLIICVCQSHMLHTLRQRHMWSYKLRWFPGKHVYDTIESSIYSYGHMPVPTIYDGLRKERREHHVDHMSVMKSNPAYTYMVICLFLQITMGLGKKEVHITLITCL